MRKAAMRPIHAVIGAALLALATSAVAQYPAKAIRIVVDTSPGGVTDILARLSADGIAQRTGQQVVVENKAGGSGVIAVDYVVNSHIIRARDNGGVYPQPSPLRTTQLGAPSEFLISTEDSRTMNNYQWHANDFDWVRSHWNQPGVTYGTGLYRHLNTAVAGAADGHVELLKVPSVIPNAPAASYPSTDLGQIGDTKNGPALWTGTGVKLFIRADSTGDPSGANVQYGF